MKQIKELKTRFQHVFHENLRDMMNYAATTYNQDTAFIIKHKDKKNVSYEYINYVEFQRDVNGLGTAMLKKGWQNKRIAIIGKNRYEWMVSYFAVQCGLGICVPLDRALPYEEFISSLERSYADVLIFDPEQLPYVEALKESGLTKVTDFICMDSLEGYENVRTLAAEGYREMTEGFEDYLSLPIDPMGTSLILFTSGTTSQAKAVQLSQHNLTSNVYAMLISEDLRRGDVSMAFLPYHHTFGAIAQLDMIAGGIVTTYCDGLKYIQKNITEYKVTIFVCVPLLVESIYKKIMATVKKQGLEKKVAFGLKVSKALLKVGIDVRRKVFKQILDQLGGNIRFVISGAAAIDPEALEGFINFGIMAVQGYGMTESSPVLAAESHWERKTGSIGKAMPGVELRIDNPNEEGIGELIGRGPNIMLGYYENQEATDEVLVDGWLHTGDLASVDEDGYIFLHGRKKNVIVLKNGKNIYPEELEILIANLPYVEESMVFGQKRHEDSDERDLAICAKIVYNKEYIKENYGTENPDEIHNIIKKDIDGINEELPTYKQMLRIITTDEPMIKTTTGKVKRFEEVKKL